jgi:hypothetical protein
MPFAAGHLKRRARSILAGEILDEIVREILDP